MTFILCHLCPWRGPHLKAFWWHLHQEHNGGILREIMMRQAQDWQSIEEKEQA